MQEQQKSTLKIASLTEEVRPCETESEILTLYRTIDRLTKEVNQLNVELKKLQDENQRYRYNLRLGETYF